MLHCISENHKNWNYYCKYSQCEQIFLLQTLYKADTSIGRTVWRGTDCLALRSDYLRKNLYKADSSIKRTLCTNVARFIEIPLYFKKRWLKIFRFFLVVTVFFFFFLWCLILFTACKIFLKTGEVHRLTKFNTAW